MNREIMEENQYENSDISEETSADTQEGLSPQDDKDEDAFSEHDDEMAEY